MAEDLKRDIVRSRPVWMNDPLASRRERRSDFVLLIRWLAPPASMVSALRAGVIQAEPALAVRFFLTRGRVLIASKRTRPLARLGYEEKKDTGG